MKMTPICYYDPEPAEHDNRCSRCGRYIKYVHTAIDGEGNEFAIGQCCARRMRESGEITGRLPLRGRYDWRMRDAREEAYWEWYCSSIAHAV